MSHDNVPEEGSASAEMQKVFEEVFAAATAGKNKDPNVLEVKAVEEIIMKDVPPGMPAPTLAQVEENLPKEEIEKRQKIMLEYSRLSARYCPPHNKKSRWVTSADLPKVLADGKDLVAMCNLPRGKYSGIAALAHPQIDDQDPLRFFILPNGMVVINPVISNHTKVTVMKKEGCMSFEENEIKEDVARFNKVTVTYQTLQRSEGSEDPVLSPPTTETFNGSMSHIYQHEISHLNGCNIYDEDYSADSSILFNDGKTDISLEDIEKMYVF